MDDQCWEGYEDPQEYHQDSVYIWAIALFIALICLFLFFDLVAPILLTIGARPVGAIWLALTQYTIYSITALLTWLCVRCIHERIHHYVAVVKGYDPESSCIKKYSYCPNQYIDRNSNICFLISPLIIIDVVALLFLLPAFPDVFSFAAIIALIYNTIGSASDIYNVIKHFRFPKGTEFKTIRTEDGFDVYYRVPN